MPDSDKNQISRLPFGKTDFGFPTPPARPPLKYSTDNVFGESSSPSLPVLAMAIPTAPALLFPSVLPNSFPRRTPWRHLVRRQPRHLRAGRPRLQAPAPAPPPVAEVAAERDDTPPLRLLEPPQEDDPFPPEVLTLTLSSLAYRRRSHRRI